MRNQLLLLKRTLLVCTCGVALVGCKKNDTSSPTANNPAPVVTDNNATAAADHVPATTAPNNTGVNVRDRAADAVTAGMQGQVKGDVDMTAAIRRLVTSGNLSTEAQNVKIVTQNGKVTLRGPVKTQDEKDAIGRMAAQIAGADNVDNQLEIEKAQ